MNTKDFSVFTRSQQKKIKKKLEALNIEVHNQKSGNKKREFFSPINEEDCDAVTVPESFPIFFDGLIYDKESQEMSQEEFMKRMGHSYTGIFNSAENNKSAKKWHFQDAHRYGKLNAYLIEVAQGEKKRLLKCSMRDSQFRHFFMDQITRGELILLEPKAYFSINWLESDSIKEIYPHEPMVVLRIQRVSYSGH
jgi:hypothetical protein